MGNIGASKLDEQKVDIIKQLLHDGHHTHQEIANMFNVSRTMISHINVGNRWNDEIKTYVKKENQPVTIKSIITVYSDGSTKIRSYE
jgi:hypothetical protein